MSNYKYPTPQLLFKAICNAIRAKTGSNDKIIHQNIPDLIDGISPENAYLSSILNIINGNTSTISNKDIISISYYRFLNNTQIKQVDLPECISIGDNAFTGCTNLTTVNLPKCTSIGAYAFGEYEIKNKYGDIIEKYSSCIDLTTISLPECTSIAYSAFSGCTNLTTVNLSKCTSIDGAFYNCTNLTTVNLPKCTSIGEYAFENCPNLTTVIFNNDEIVQMNSAYMIFEGTPIKDGTGYIYVPNDLVDSYKTDTKWSTYANQIKPISELPNNIKEEYGYD